MAAEHEDRNDSVAAQFKEQQRPLGGSKEAKIMEAVWVWCPSHLYCGAVFLQLLPMCTKLHWTTSE